MIAWPSAKRNRLTPRAVHYKVIETLCWSARSGLFFFLRFSANVNWKLGHVSTISHERTFQKQKENLIKLEKVNNKLGLIAILKRGKKCNGSRHATEPAVKQSVEMNGHNKTTIDFPENECNKCLCWLLYVFCD